MRAKLYAMPISLCSITTSTRTQNGSSTSERTRVVPGVFGGSGREFTLLRGPENYYENGNCRNCTLRLCRSGESGSLQLMVIEESLDRNARISTCLTFRT